MRVEFAPPPNLTHDRENKSLPFENSPAAAAPTRRSSRPRFGASEAPAAGTTTPLSVAESAISAVAPLTRRAARQALTADLAAASAPADVTDDAVGAEPVVEAPAEKTPASDPTEIPAVPLAPEAVLGSVFAAPAAGSSTPGVTADDAFERASRAFRGTGPFRTSAAASVSEETEEPTAERVPTRRPRNVRKVFAVGASVGVMSLAGLLAVSMTVPAEALAATRGGSVASASLVAGVGGSGDKAADDEIQAFVTPDGLQNESLARAGDYSTVSLVEVAAEQGINYSGDLFTNDPDAAIQWPFMVGVGMSYGYGMRSGRLHEGIDFVPGNGAPIQAIADGVVRKATEQGGAYGVTVYIDHVIDGKVITSHYSHMQYGSLQVKDGDKVTVGTVIGKTGNTGRSYGAHLHFELIVNGSTIDPMPWLRANAGRDSY